MIQKLSHATIYVLDQDIAKDFYVNKLGCELKMDVDMGPFRWLTVSPKGQPDLELALMAVKPSPLLNEEDCEKVRELVVKGKMPGGVFGTADCRKTYEELKAKGVEFKQEPKEQFYGIEAILKDPFGNWFSLTQEKEMPAKA